MYRPPLHLSVVAIEKGAFRSPSTKVINFTFTYYDVSRRIVRQSYECMVGGLVLYEGESALVLYEVESYYGF